MNQIIYNNKPESRFGTALSSIDINLDGYKGMSNPTFLTLINISKLNDVI